MLTDHISGACDVIDCHISLASMHDAAGKASPECSGNGWLLSNHLQFTPVLNAETCWNGVAPQPAAQAGCCGRHQAPPAFASDSTSYMFSAICHICRQYDTAVRPHPAYQAYQATMALHTEDELAASHLFQVVHHGNKSRRATAAHTCRMLSSATEAMTQSSDGFHAKSEILLVWPPWMNSSSGGPSSASSFVCKIQLTHRSQLRVTP